MVRDQLLRRGIQDPRVLGAMWRVHREAFISPGQADFAYRDAPLPIGHGQTISQPYTVAFMCESLHLRGYEKVLEVGTGSGYGAAVLAHLSRQVYTLERIGEVHENAARRLSDLGYDNVTAIHANGTLGFPPAAPYDAILVTACGQELPLAYRQQLIDGGRIVIPLGEPGEAQRMYRFTLRNNRWHEEDLGAFTFVPLVAGEDGEHQGE